MRHLAKRFFSGTFFMVMSMLLVFSVFLPSTYADNLDHTEQGAVINLSGRNADGRYELTTKDLYLFSLEGTAPGDCWAGTVLVQNTTDSDMAVAVHSITSTLTQDTALFDILDLKISAAGEECYNGPYAANDCPVTEYHTVKAGESLPFDIQVIFPSTAGNLYQGKQMDSTWTFDAVFFDGKAPGSQAPGDTAPDVSISDPFDDFVKTGGELPGSNTSLIMSLVLFLSSGTALLITFFRYRSAKKRQKQWQSREEGSISNRKEDK